MDEIKTITENVLTEITEKKSKFIANLCYVNNINQAEEQLNAIRKKYHDARHNCYAYRILENEKIISKSSDDGEPSGTAGSPMLSILEKSELCNILIVVTRYFGGILLGTGGLVRAYSGALQKAIENSNLAIEKIGSEIEIILTYKDFEKFKYYCKKNTINILNARYVENVFCTIEVQNSKIEKILNDAQKNEIYMLKFNILGNKTIKENIEK